MASPAAIADAFARIRAAGFVGRGTEFSDLDLPAAGHLIGVGEDEIHAVIEVETNGGAFDALKRPKMLFEPHLLYKHLAGADRAHAVSIGIAYAKWAKIKDTPWSPETDATRSPVPVGKVEAKLLPPLVPAAPVLPPPKPLPPVTTAEQPDLLARVLDRLRAAYPRKG